MELTQSMLSVSGTYRTNPDPYSYYGEWVSIHGKIVGTIKREGSSKGFTGTWSETFKHTKKDGTVDQYQRNGDFWFPIGPERNENYLMFSGWWAVSGWGSPFPDEGSWEGNNAARAIPPPPPGHNKLRAVKTEVNTEKDCLFTVIVTNQKTGQRVALVNLRIVITDMDTMVSERTGTWNKVTDATGVYSWRWTWRTVDAAKRWSIDITAFKNGYESDQIPTNYVTAPGLTFYSVCIVASDFAWCVGSNRYIGWWDGSKWARLPSPSDNSRGDILYSVFSLTLDDAWAVGSDGWIIHWDGRSWRNVDSPTRDTLMSVHMSSRNEGWAVGHFGRIIHWDGSSWSNVKSPTKQRLNSVSVSPSGTGAFAVGDEGTIIRWSANGAIGAWELEKTEAMVPYPRQFLNSVFVLHIDTSRRGIIGSADVWAVGDLGQIIHYDGKAWSKVRSPTSNNLNSVFMMGPLEGVAVGDHGTIIKLNLFSSSLKILPSTTNRDLFSVSIEKYAGFIGYTVGEGGVQLPCDLREAL